MDTESMGDLSKCGDTLYVPEVASNYKPYKGQEFNTLGDAYCFYNKYAEEAGFSTRIHSSKKDMSNEITRKEYVCFKEGNARQSNVVDRKRRRSIIRCGCSAKLAVVKSKLGNYVVSLFVEGHNHALSTPRKVQILRSHRSISAVQKCLSQQLHIGQFALQNEMKGHDAELLYEYFQSEHEKNSSFFFNIKSRDDDRITHCFWADAICRRAYKFYGDVVVFDTTYNTNRYDMIFAHFVGVNNHGQTVLFGCGFLNDETTESFVWLFEQFKKAMPGNDSKMIITGQDPAMTKAISQSFPHTFHRFCIWHILNKFSERLSTIAYREHYKHFQKCIWESNTVEEFDTMWKDIINKATLTDNEWLQGVYEIRSKWVPTYVNHLFSAGMSISQRGESNHVFFKRYVSKKNSLLDFVVRFNRALSRQRHEELIVDNKNMNERPMLRLPLEIEKQMSDIYTQAIFYKFQDELWNSLLHVIELVRENENCWVYNVVSKKDGVSKVFEVLRDKSSEFVSCICKKFDSEGIPCTHILALFYKLQIRYMSDVYVLKRWTKAAKLERIVDDNGFEINDCSDKSFLFRRTKLFKLASNLIDRAAFSEEATKICTDSLNGLIEHVNSLIESCTSEGVSEKDNCVQLPHFNEPLQVRDKGCDKRLKGGKETTKDKAKDKSKRRCNGCGEVGQSHDKRNCPLLMKRFRSVVIQERNMNSSDSDNESYSSIVDEEKHPGKLPRAYTLTHSDITSKLTLAISQTINSSQLQGWYNRLQRDEVVAEWKKVKGNMSLHVHCHISGGHFLLDLFARLRFFIFCKELPVVLKAFVHGDGYLFNNYPELQEALVWVYFHSNISEFNKVECWGPLKEAVEWSIKDGGSRQESKQETSISNLELPEPCQESCNCCLDPMVTNASPSK